jgi:two-component SAPR family response regulator
MNILIISDDENSEIIKTLNRRKMVTVIRRTILTAMDFLRYNDVSAIIIDKKHRDVDILEFSLNIRDINKLTPIFIINEPFDEQMLKPGLNIHTMNTFYSDFLITGKKQN